MTLTYRKVKRIMEEKGYAFFTNPDSINIIGVRNNESTNEFSDYLCVLWIDSATGREKIMVMPATTKPGRHWLLSPLHRKGTAILVEGQYRGAYKVGTHNRSRPSRSYEALEQKAIMKYFRDNNLDSIHDYNGPVYEGNFKTNIHRAAASGLSLIHI